MGIMRSQFGGLKAVKLVKPIIAILEAPAMDKIKESMPRYDLPSFVVDTPFVFIKHISLHPITA